MNQIFDIFQMVNKIEQSLLNMLWGMRNRSVMLKVVKKKSSIGVGNVY